MLAPFVYPRFRRVWMASFVSQLGDWMQIFGRAFLAFELTGRAETVGIVYFATFLPQLVLSLWGGVLADRIDRKRLLLLAQAMQAAGAVVMGLLVVTDTATVANVTLISLVLGIGFTLQIPALQALLPTLVPQERLASAISLSTATNSLTRVVGPLLAAAVIPVVGVEWVFWANAASFGFLMAAWLGTKVPPQPFADRGGFKALGEGIAFVHRTPSVATPIGATAFLSSISMVYQPLLIVYATACSPGVTATSVCCTTDGSRPRSGWAPRSASSGWPSSDAGTTAQVFIATVLILSITLGAVGLIDMIGGAVFNLLVLGAAQSANMTLAISIVQYETPEVMRGRVMSIQVLALVGFLPIASLLGGWLADQTGLDRLFVGAGLACLGFSSCLLRWRRHFRTTAIDRGRDTDVVVSTVLEDEG